MSIGLFTECSVKDPEFIFFIIVKIEKQGNYLY